MEVWPLAPSLTLRDERKDILSSINKTIKQVFIK